MRAIEKLYEKLISGQICAGASITLTDQVVTDVLADSVDFLWVDLEHCAMSPEALEGHLLAARGKNVPMLVRVPGGGAHIIKPVLDAGAEGIVVPQIRTADEVREVVGDCRYPPVGKRGLGPRIPTNYFRADAKEYVQWANKNLFVAVMIETAEALKNIDEIFSVPGLDGIFIGPYDLALSLGIVFDLLHPKVVDAISTIISKARKSGLFVGSGMGADPEYACRMAAHGVQLLQIGCDYQYMQNSLDRIVSIVKNRL
ncbi:MAG: hypothetical protein FIA99_09615 [Ruminiclostridium sp.]|nr:hypothetical protein [Ruminiclostridium sp.]